MKNINDICVVVQARLSSQRIPGKMLKPFAGTTLTEILLRKLNYSTIIPKNQIYFSAFEQELKDVASKNSINIFHRSEQSALSEGTPLSEIYEWHDKLPYKYALKINGCCPLLKVSTINNFYDHFYKQQELHTGLERLQMKMFRLLKL